MANSFLPCIPEPKVPGRFRPPRKVKRADILRPSDLRHVLRVIQATSRWPERDQCLVLISVCVGMRVTEIARLTPRILMTPAGVIREQCTLPAEITKGCKPRPAYFSNERLLESLDRYIESRHSRGYGLSGQGEYHGLRPDQPLIYSTRNGGYTLSRKPRELETGEVVEYLAADGLEHHFRTMYDRSGLPGASSHTGRRTFASGLLAKGVSSEDISMLLGHTELDVTGVYLECTDQMVEEALREVF